MRGLRFLSKQCHCMSEHSPSHRPHSENIHTEPKPSECPWRETQRCVFVVHKRWEKASSGSLFDDKHRDRISAACFNMNQICTSPSMLHNRGFNRKSLWNYSLTQPLDGLTHAFTSDISLRQSKITIKPALNIRRSGTLNTRLHTKRWPHLLLLPITNSHSYEQKPPPRHPRRTRLLTHCQRYWSVHALCGSVNVGLTVKQLISDIDCPLLNFYFLCTFYSSSLCALWQSSSLHFFGKLKKRYDLLWAQSAITLEKLEPLKGRSGTLISKNHALFWLINNVTSH